MGDCMVRPLVPAIVLSLAFLAGCTSAPGDDLAASSVGLGTTTGVGPCTALAPDSYEGWEFHVHAINRGTESVCVEVRLETSSFFVGSIPADGGGGRVHGYGPLFWTAAGGQVTARVANLQTGAGQVLPFELTEENHLVIVLEPDGTLHVEKTDEAPRFV